MKKEMTLREKIGQRLFVSFDGTTLTEELKHLISEYKAGNIVLFQPNIESIPQLKALCREISDFVEKETGLPPFISIDQEGGGVTRLSPDCVNVAGAMAIAATTKPENAYKAALLTGEELRALGINFNLAPVADVSNNPDNPVIGIRSYGNKAEDVSRYAIEAFRGYEDAIIASCAKHFPGHGDTGMDSHVSLPVIDKTMDELRNLELVPFKALIEAGCPAVMSAHILYPKIEGENVPATMSRLFMHDLLRGELGFEGLVLSDSLEMDAIRKYYGVSRGAVRSIKAGVDIILTGKGSEVIISEAEAIECACLAGEISMEEMDESVGRIITFKKKYCLPPKGEAGLATHQAASDEIRRESITLVKGRLPTLGENPLFAGPGDYRLTLVSNEVGNTKTFPQYMCQRFGGRELSTDNTPSDETIARAVGMVEGSTAVVVNTYNGHVFPRQLEMANALIREARRLNIPTVVVTLRNLNDLSRISDCDAALAGWDYSMMTLDILAEVLSGGLVPGGVVPIDLPIH